MRNIETNVFPTSSTDGLLFDLGEFLDPFEPQVIRSLVIKYYIHFSDDTQDFHKDQFN